MGLAPLFLAILGSSTEAQLDPPEDVRDCVVALAQQWSNSPYGSDESGVPVEWQEWIKGEDGEVLSLAGLFVPAGHQLGGITQITSKIYIFFIVDLLAFPNGGLSTKYIWASTLVHELGHAKLTLDEGLTIDAHPEVVDYIVANGGTLGDVADWSCQEAAIAQAHHSALCDAAAAKCEDVENKWSECTSIVPANPNDPNDPDVIRKAECEEELQELMDELNVLCVDMSEIEDKWNSFLGRKTTQACACDASFWPGSTCAEFELPEPPGGCIGSCGDGFAGSDVVADCRDNEDNDPCECN